MNEDEEYKRIDFNKFHNLRPAFQVNLIKKRIDDHNISLIKIVQDLKTKCIKQTHIGLIYILIKNTSDFVFINNLIILLFYLSF